MNWLYKVDDDDDDKNNTDALNHFYFLVSTLNKNVKINSLI